MQDIFKSVETCAMVYINYAEINSKWIKYQDSDNSNFQKFHLSELNVQSLINFV